MSSLPDHLKKNYNNLTIWLLIILDICQNVLINIVFLFYQLFIKKYPFGVFDSVKKIDVIMEYSGSKFNFRRNSLVTSLITAFIFALSLLATYLGGHESINLYIGIAGYISTLLSFRIFLVLFLIISLCNEVRARLKVLRSFLEVKQLNSEIISIMLELASDTMKNIGNFFAVELLSIMSLVLSLTLTFIRNSKIRFIS